MDIGY